MGGKRIDESVRQKVQKAHAGGLSRKEIAKKFGISPTSVSRIVKGSKAPKLSEKKAEPSPPVDQGDRDKKLEEVERRVMELERRILYWHSKKRT